MHGEGQHRGLHPLHLKLLSALVTQKACSVARGVTASRSGELRGGQTIRSSRSECGSSWCERLSGGKTGRGILGLGHAPAFADVLRYKLQ